METVKRRSKLSLSRVNLPFVRFFLLLTMGIRYFASLIRSCETPETEPSPVPRSWGAIGRPYIPGIFLGKLV
jgi:hypothetical protein